MKKSILFLIFFTTSFLTSFSQTLFKSYDSGIIYTSDGKVMKGFLSFYNSTPTIFESSDAKILYFKTESGLKSKILASEIKSFIINTSSFLTDSFVTVHKIDNSRIKYNIDFLQVLLNFDSVKLYQYRILRKAPIGFNGIGGTINYNDNYYYYGKNANSSVELSRKDFKKVMSEMLKADDEIVKMINDKQYIYSDMQEMIKIYKQKHPEML